MADQNRRLNNFNDRAKPATITAVYPQTQTVDIKYTQQDGARQALDLPYGVVGATWGRLFMPQIGDRVIVDFTQGELPLIVSMKPTNTDFLPYLYPGELVDMNSDGSYVHMRNARRRVQSTGELIGYADTKGPNGETDIETEPGGVVIGIRSKQDISTKAPRWYEHSYLSMFDNGDISLQSRYRGQERGLLYMDGTNGYVFLTAGLARPQEYIELDPVHKLITILSDGDIHIHGSGDKKETTYGDMNHNVSGVYQVTAGVPPNQIPVDFNKANVSPGLLPGDIVHGNMNATHSVLQTLNQIASALKNGQLHILNGETGEISSVAPNVCLGDLLENLQSSQFNVINNFHLNNFATQIQSWVGLTMQIHAALMVTAAIPNASNLLPELGQSFLNKIGVPSVQGIGSNIVKAKS